MNYDEQLNKLIESEFKSAGCKVIKPKKIQGKEKLLITYIVPGFIKVETIKIYSIKDSDSNVVLVYENGNEIEVSKKVIENWINKI